MRLMPRRSGDSLFELELEVLGAALSLTVEGVSEFHGYQLTKAIGARGRTPLGHGSIYRALLRLESLGLLESTWEDHKIAEREGRPRRRLYRITAAGAKAIAAQATLTSRSRQAASLAR